MTSNTNWHCDPCGYCCQMERTILTEIDILRIFQTTGSNAVEKGYVKPVDPFHMVRMRSTLQGLAKRKKAQMGQIIITYDLLEKPFSPCRFLLESNKCSVYKKRPTACKGYPISLYPHPGTDEITLAINSDCPSGPDLYTRVMVNHEPISFPIEHLWSIQQALCERVLIASTYKLVFDRFGQIVSQPMGLIEYHARAHLWEIGESKMSLRTVYNSMEATLEELAISPKITSILSAFFKLTEDRQRFTVKSQILRAQGRERHRENYKKHEGVVKL